VVVSGAGKQKSRTVACAACLGCEVLNARA
jgi:hypothetical protein